MVSKKFKKIAVITVAIILIAELIAVLANNLFFEKVATQEAIDRSLPSVSGNAIKHAYASSLVYSSLRTFFINEFFAEEITITLGKVNEIAETIFKSQQDSTLEMVKDLQNNVLGICAAKLIEENPNNPAIQDRIGLIGNLAQNNKLILTRDNVLLDKTIKEKISGTHSYSNASELFDQSREKILCNFDLENDE